MMLASKLLHCRSFVALSRTFPRSLVRSCHGTAEGEEQQKLLVYEGEHVVKLRFVKYLSLTSTAAFLAMGPAMYSKLVAMNAGVFAWSLSFGAILFGASTPAILHLITRGYVLAMRFDPDTRVFEIDTFNIFARRQTIKFTQDDVEHQDLLGPFSNCVIKDKPYLLDYDAILDPEALTYFMKYDKPIDLKLSPTPTTENN